MQDIWKSLSGHWESWLVPFVCFLFGGAIGFAAGAFKWYYPTRQALREEREQKAAERLDVAILVYLESQGSMVSGSDQVSDALKVHRETVIEGLQRLEVRGRIGVSPGGFETGKGYFYLHL
jgi:hypothetical protein